MSKKLVSIFCLIFLMVTTVVWAKPDSAYIDNGDGTVTDIETKLIWQQGPAGEMNWNGAMSYCSGLSLAGYKDWRLPTLDELKTLVDSTQTPPMINHMFFPGTVSSFYWSSTTYAYSTNYAWGVYFNYGYDNNNNKLNSSYVRAVRGGQPGLLGNLVISPLSQMVTKDAGSTSFSVSNTGTGIIPWKAAVTSDSSWLTIKYGSSGTNTGVITCYYTANTSTSSRTGTIQVTAYGATGTTTQKDVTVTQAPVILRYVDNGNGTVTDTSSSLIWQQATAPNTYNWDQAISYCRSLSFAGYTDWRLPTLDELKTLLDYTQAPPKINHMYFPDTVSSFYWSSTTDASSTYSAWGVDFLNGNVYIYYMNLSYYVRAVRGGPSGSLGNLVISPLSQMVTKDTGSTTFSVYNTGTGTMPWSAAVTSGGTWLTITSGTSGTDTGTINCSFTANTGTSTSARTATIRVTATGAIGSPVDVTVTQAPAILRYIDNGDGTVIDIETKLIWQQGPAGKMHWNGAMSYCSGLLLAGYKDWRLPTLDELKTLVDSTQSPPKINHMYFPGTVSSFYWSSTTAASSTDYAWGVDFDDGGGYVYVKTHGCYVRAVRGGQSGSLDNLVISPSNQAVSKEAGSTSFSVSNTGTGIIPWTAAVTSGSSWLTITYGSSGIINFGTIKCIFTANTSRSSRTGTIRVTAYGATGTSTQKDVTVTQEATPTPTPTACTATTDGNLLLHIPYLSYIDPASETLSFLADLVNEVNPTYPMLILFKLTNLKIIENPSFSCEASTLSNDFKIHIPDFLLPDGITHLWVDMEYSQALSTDVNVYFEVKKLGVVSN